MADSSKQDEVLTSTGQHLPPSTKDKSLEDVVTEQENESEKDGSTASIPSAKIHLLHKTTRNLPRLDWQKRRIS